MSRYTVTMSLPAARSRILVAAGTDEIMRAVLPSVSEVQHPRAAMILLASPAGSFSHPGRSNFGQ
jgi:hypothetical protein